MSKGLLYFPPHHSFPTPILLLWPNLHYCSVYIFACLPALLLKLNGSERLNVTFTRGVVKIERVNQQRNIRIDHWSTASIFVLCERKVTKLMMLKNVQTRVNKHIRKNILYIFFTLQYFIETYSMKGFFLLCICSPTTQSVVRVYFTRYLIILIYFMVPQKLATLRWQ